jgi:hypothetical protein
MQMRYQKNFSFCTFFHQQTRGYPHTALSLLPQILQQCTLKSPQGNDKNQHIRGKVFSVVTGYKATPEALR